MQNNVWVGYDKMNLDHCCPPSLKLWRAKPGWWNGIHARLKILYSIEYAGPIPALGTNMAKIGETLPCFQDDGSKDGFIVCPGFFTEDCPLVNIINSRGLCDSLPRIRHVEVLEKTLSSSGLESYAIGSKINNLKVRLFCSRVFLDVPTENFYSGYTDIFAEASLSDED